MTVLAALTPALAVVASIAGLLGWRGRRQQREAVGVAFRATVETLGSDVRVERLGAAILLRRFFIDRSEYSRPNEPYADEAIDVISATLRSEPTGDVQKVLVDGLAYVSSRRLTSKDFQHTNLSDGLLTLSGPLGDSQRDRLEARAKRWRDRWIDRLRSRTPPTEGGKIVLRLDVSKSDFFRARMAHASLRENSCRETVFIEAIAPHAVFRDCDLTGARFDEADLRNARFDGAVFLDRDLTGARFDEADLARFDEADLRKARFDGADLKGAVFEGARLAGASFVGAVNIPPAVAVRLDENRIHVGDSSEVAGRQVFVSAPSVAVASGFDEVGRVVSVLENEGFDVIRMDPSSYEPDEPLGAVRRTVVDCVGLVAIGVQQLAIEKGVWRPSTSAATSLDGQHLHTPWNDIEVGMAVALGVPVLAVRAGCAEHGVFELSSQSGFVGAGRNKDGRSDDLSDLVRDWAAALPLRPR